MKTITFYSYKGGVGRSLALSNIAIRLSELKKKVCVLDFDLEAPGMQFKFDNYRKSKDIEKGIVDYIYEFTEKNHIPQSLNDFYLELHPASELFEKISLIPAGNIDSKSYWQKLSGINWGDMFYGEESKGVQFFLDLKHKIESEIKPDFLLIDSRTGITDIAGITLKLFADEAVILAANNQENIYGSTKIIKSLIQKDNLLFDHIPKITFVLTRLPYTDSPIDKEKEATIIKIRTTELLDSVNLSDLEILVIHSDRRLEENERSLIGDDYEAKTVSISNDYLKLFDRLTDNMLSESEIVIFRNKKIAVKEFRKGIRENDNTQKINHFSVAIEKDSTNADYYLQRGNIYLKINDLESAEKDFLNALELNPNSSRTLNSVSVFYSKVKNYSKALELINKAILNDSENVSSYHIKSIILREQKDFDNALLTLNYVIEKIDENNSDLLNSRADLLRIIGKYEEAYIDVFNAIEINPESPLYFGTLAEIYAMESKTNEFYLNLNIALSKGVTVKQLAAAKNVYEKFAKEEKFIDLMEKYSIDLDELFTK